MVGQWMRLNRLFSNSRRAVLVGLDDVLVSSAPRQQVDVPELVGELSDADGIILTPGMLRRCAHGFDFRGAPLAIVRLDWVAVPEPEGYRAAAAARVTDPARAQAMGADMVLASLAVSGSDAAADAEAVASMAELASQRSACGIPLIGEVRPPGAANMLADQLFAQTDAGCRLLSELGADVLISFLTGDRMAETAEACLAPVLAMPQTSSATKMDLLQFAYQAVKAGARGVRVGREIADAPNPAGLVRALQAVVKDETDPEAAAAEHGVR